MLQVTSLVPSPPPGARGGTLKLTHCHARPASGTPRLRFIPPRTLMVQVPVNMFRMFWLTPPGYGSQDGVAPDGSVALELWSSSDRTIALGGPPGLKSRPAKVGLSLRTLESEDYRRVAMAWPKEAAETNR